MNIAKFFYIAFLGVFYCASESFCVVEIGNYEKFDRLKKYVDCLIIAKPSIAISFKGVIFDDFLVQQCAKNIEQEQSFVPLGVTLKYMQESGDTKQLCSFSLLLLTSYHIVLKDFNAHNRAGWFAIISLYAQLNMIPLTKLFDSLEECWQRYQAIVENFSDDPDESMLSWVQNNWWIPATMVIFTAYSFLRWYKNRIGNASKIV